VTPRSNSSLSDSGSRASTRWHRERRRPHAGLARRACCTEERRRNAFYLRANQLAYEVSHWAEARDLYRACLNLDPDYAPGWARLARCERLIGKFSSSAEQATANLARAEEAFQRALALNSDLSIGHSLYAQLMIDVGRADDAMRLLLERATRRPTDPELYAGLVHALRYCGLLEASVAAHHRARHLDPTVPTSIHHTWWMMGEYQGALTQTLGDIGYMQGLALASLGREREAIAATALARARDDRRPDSILSDVAARTARR
jgi:tetratricopeptide (TPR) repeat protein